MRKVLVLVLMFCLTTAAFAVELSTAKISAVTGVAETSKIDENKKQVWSPVKVDLVLNQGDEIRTREGKVELTFEDGSKINLKENTSLSLNKLKDKDQTGDTIVKLWIGKIRSKFTIQKDDSTFQVQTKNIIAAVKGTDFSLDADTNGSDLVVFDGIVSMKDPIGKKEIFVKAGEKASFAGAFEGKPEEMSKEEKEKQDEIRTREGKVELTFEDGSKINLKENTSLSLNKLKDKDQTGDTIVKLWIGKIRSKFTIQKDDST